MKPSKKWAWLAASLSALIIAGQIFRYPSAVREVISGQFIDGVRLAYPLVYTLFAPFFQIADRFSILSVNQHIALFIFANGLRLVWRWAVFFRNRFRWKMLIGETVRAIIFNLLYAALAAAAILFPRPMAKLEVKDPDLLIFDAHSHTSHSWDARKSFSPAKSLEWHFNAGFNAVFITDHNRISGSEEARALALNSQRKDWIVPLPGEELSLQKCHLAILGNRSLIPNGPYDGEIEGVERFFRSTRSSTTLVIASLPEYWLYHWKSREDFVKWGVRGFEIVNSAPVALDFPRSKQAEMIAFCRERRLIMTGITDTHGWGSTVYVWNVTRLPGWRQMSLDGLRNSLLQHLAEKKDQAVQIFCRVKAQPGEGGLWLALDPARQLWKMFRSIPPVQAASFLFWIWAGFILYLRINRD